MWYNPAVRRDLINLFASLALLLMPSHSACCGIFVDFPISFLVLFYILYCPHKLTHFQIVFLPFFFSFFSFNSCPPRSLHFIQFSSFTTAVSPWGIFWFQYSNIASTNGHHSKRTSSHLKGNRGEKGSYLHRFLFHHKENRETVHKSRGDKMHLG